MFYSQFILAKKGPLGTIWIAAHLERKLRKNQVADTDIGVSVDSILFPEVPIALRLSSHLLLGVVRIYSKKVNYLFDDCSEALLKVKQAFRSTAVDLPPEQSKAPYHSITLPETFDLDDFELPDNEISQGNFVDHHVSAKEQITLQDTLDGGSLPTSQFGLDERFGDGDASQIGLDLDEELLMDKGDGAGTSGNLVGTDVDPLASTKESPHSKSNELDEDVSNPPLASNTNYFSIQAPSTPGLMGEPNLPSAKEEVQVSDEHMDDHFDEDLNASELAPKEVFGIASSPMDPSDLRGPELHANENFHYMDKHNEQVGKTLETEPVDFISSNVGQPATFKHNLDTNIDLNNVGIIPDNEGTIVADKIETPMDENAVVMGFKDTDSYSGYNKTDINGTCHPLHDNEVEINQSPIDHDVQISVEAEKSVSELQDLSQHCLNFQNVEMSLSDFTTPVLQACTSKLSSFCDDVDNVNVPSNFPAQEDGSSFGTAIGEGAVNISGTSSNVGDAMEPISKEYQITHGVSFADVSHFGGSLGNLISEGNHFEKENNLELSNFPPPELLLSMPYVPSGPSPNFGVHSTPGIELSTKDGDANDENLVSGRKRSFTESNLTFQSFYSVESSGQAHSKGIVDFVPNDNDLLSSILVGRSTGLKMKPTPPVPDTVRRKRQRTAERSVVHKRKLLIDDSTVLHGDTIRQQLTSTEDIRRVRKKAPCTHLEVWVLQKLFLEDQIFGESIFTGTFPALRSLNTEEFDLNGIQIRRDDKVKEASEADIATRPTFSEEFDLNGVQIYQDNKIKEASEADIATRPTIGEDTEAIGPYGPITTDISAGPKPNEETEDVGPFTSSVAEQEPTLIDNDVMREVSRLDVPIEKTGIEYDDSRTFLGGEVTQPVTSEGVPESLVGTSFEENYNLTDHANVDPTSLNKFSDNSMLMIVNDSDQLLDQRSPLCTIGDNPTAEDVSRSGAQDQGLEFGLDERSGGEHVLEMRENFDTNLIAGNRQNNCFFSELESGACPTTKQVECSLDGLVVLNKDEALDSSLIHDGSFPTSEKVGDHVNLDSSGFVETNMGSEKTTLIEMEGEEDDPKIVMDFTPVLAEFIDTNNAELRTDVVEHDTDFLNVDDDDDVEDYESDMPDSEEKRILDNSGWSSRTRAVANYLQGLFEKEYDPAKRVVSLDNLLVGKTCKEASRMFFETLVLKTKDYIQTEQDTSFSDIRLKPRGKLLKSEFRSHA